MLSRGVEHALHFGALSTNGENQSYFCFKITGAKGTAKLFSFKVPYIILLDKVCVGYKTRAFTGPKRRNLGKNEAEIVPCIKAFFPEGH